MKRIEHIEFLPFGAGPLPRAKTWPEYRAHVCPAALLGSDLVAFGVTMFVAFAITGPLGTSPFGTGAFGGLSHSPEVQV